MVFCDLDGTLVLDNSFHVFIASAYSAGGFAQRMSLALRLAPRVFGRSSGGHVGMKRRVLRWFNAQTDAWQDRVVELTVARLMKTISEPMSRVLQAHAAQGARVVLATAAPAVYATRIARAMKADACLATEFPADPAWRELLADEKARACADWLDAQGLARGGDADAPRVVVLTDHGDDLPLLRLADEAVIQASPRRFAKMSAALASEAQPPRLTHIDPLTFQEGGGMWLWINDSPWGPYDRWELRTVLSKHRHALLYCGAGLWQPIRPGQSLGNAALRRDCPSPPGSRQRLSTYLRRRLVRDWLGVFH